jgi:hypothetical protein
MFSKKNLITALLAVLSISLFTVGILNLTKPRIDISSDEKMKESTERLRDSLNDEQKEKFEKAVGYIAFDGLTFNDIMSADETIKKIKKKFKNKSYDDIIYDAKQIVKRRINELNKEKASLASARKSLESIVVERTTMTTDTSGLFPRRILYMMVRNDTGRNLSSISFNIKTFAPGREIPYLNDDFRYEIPGGIQGKETLEWQLEPNTLLNDEWNRDIPNGIIQIRATACADANGNVLFQDTWDSQKDNLLSTLKEFMKD